MPRTNPSSKIYAAQLPGTMEDMVRQALVDLESFEGSPQYDIDMDVTYRAAGPGRARKAIGLEGAVMLRRTPGLEQALNAPGAPGRLRVTEFGAGDSEKLHSLDLVRLGMFVAAVYAFYYGDGGGKNLQTLDFRELDDLDFVAYENDPAAFKATLTGYADALKRLGL